MAKGTSFLQDIFGLREFAQRALASPHASDSDSGIFISEFANMVVICLPTSDGRGVPETLAVGPKDWADCRDSDGFWSREQRGVVVPPGTLTVQEARADLLARLLRDPLCCLALASGQEPEMP